MEYYTHSCVGNDIKQVENNDIDKFNLKYTREVYTFSCKTLCNHNKLFPFILYPPMKLIHNTVTFDGIKAQINNIEDVNVKKNLIDLLELVIESNDFNRQETQHHVANLLQRKINEYMLNKNSSNEQNQEDGLKLFAISKKYIALFRKMITHTVT